MKTISIILLLMVTVSVSFARTKHPKQDVKVLSDKEHVVFFKVDKSFVGGVVEIYSADRKFLESEELPHTHTKIFFDEAPAGNYIIKVKKGPKSIELEYRNF